MKLMNKLTITNANCVYLITKLQPLNLALTSFTT